MVLVLIWDTSSFLKSKIKKVCYLEQLGFFSSLTKLNKSSKKQTAMETKAVFNPAGIQKIFLILMSVLYKNLKNLKEDWNAGQNQKSALSATKLEC